MVASPGHPELNVERKKCLKSVVLYRRLLYQVPNYT